MRIIKLKTLSAVTAYIALMGTTAIAGGDIAPAKSEIKDIEIGNADKENNVLKNAPHTAATVSADEWSHDYSRSKAAFPLDWIRENKYWVPVGRVDNAWGDRNLICNCGTPEEYEAFN